MSRRWLVIVSVAAHLSILVGLFLSGIWRIERLEGGRARVSLTQPLTPPPPPPAAPGHPSARPPETPVVPRKIVAKEPRQPVPHPEPHPTQVNTATISDFSKADGSGADGPPDSPCVADCGDGDKAPPVCGNGALEIGEQCDDGNTIDGDGCSASCRLEPRPQPPAVATVAPRVLQGLRLSGETQVHPSAVTQSQMTHDGTRQVDGIVKLCVAVDGSVASAKVLVSTRYPAYDAVLLAAVRDWRYQPYMVGDRAVPACSTVRFVYTIQ